MERPRRSCCRARVGVKVYLSWVRGSRKSKPPPCRLRDKDGASHFEMASCVNLNSIDILNARILIECFDDCIVEFGADLLDGLIGTVGPSAVCK